MRNNCLILSKFCSSVALPLITMLTYSQWPVRFVSMPFPWARNFSSFAIHIEVFNAVLSHNTFHVALRGGKACGGPGATFTARGCPEG